MLFVFLVAVKKIILYVLFVPYVPYMFYVLSAQISYDTKEQARTFDTLVLFVPYNEPYLPPEGVSVKKFPFRYITNNNDKKDKKYKKHAVPPYKTITFSTH